MDDLVVRKVADDLLTPARVRDIVDRAAQMQSDARQQASVRIEQLKRQLATAKKKENNLWDLAAEQGLKVRQKFLARLDAVQEEAIGLQRQIAIQEKLIASSVRPLTPTEADQKARKMRDLSGR